MTGKWPNEIAKRKPSASANETATDRKKAKKNFFFFFFCSDMKPTPKTENGRNKFLFKLRCTTVYCFQGGASRSHLIVD